MRATRASAAVAALGAAILACPSCGTSRRQGRSTPDDTARAASVAADTAATASDSGPCGVLALGNRWTALERRGDSLAVVEHCFGFVPYLSLALDSTPPRLVHGYGQDAEVFEVGARLEDDTLLRLEIRSRHRPGPGTLQLVVRDRPRGVVEASEAIGGQRRPRELFVSDRFAAHFPRVPRPADCGQP